jgi:Tfp pilus assembly protein PilO
VNADQQFALILVGIFGVLMPVVLAIGIPAGKAWARRLERGGQSQDRGETAAELSELRARVAELEERLDFTERVLATRRESPQLSAGDQ